MAACVRLVLGPLCALSVACAVTSLEVLSSGASRDDAGGPSDATSDDAGAPDALAGDARGASDAGDAGDAGGPSDATSDAGMATPFCRSLSPAPLFCSDFDDGDDAGFSGAFLDKGAVTVDSRMSRSPPSALLSTLSSTTGAPSMAALTFTTTGSSHFRIGAAVLLEKFSSTSRAEILLVNALAPSPGYQVGLLLYSSGAINMYEFSNGDAGLHNEWPLTTKVGLNEWVRFEIAVDVTQKTAQVTTNGGAPETFDIHPVGVPTALQFTCGVAYADVPHDGWAARFDDVVFDR